MRGDLLLKIEKIFIISTIRLKKENVILIFINKNSTHLTIGKSLNINISWYVGYLPSDHCLNKPKECFNHANMQ